MTPVADIRADRPIYAQPRLTDRWEVAGPEAERRVAALFDAQLPVDPMYPVRQRVRSTYLAPPAGWTQPQTVYPRVREYLGPLAASDGPSSAFLELKFAAADGSKRKERLPVARDVLDRIVSEPPRTALDVDVRIGDEQRLAQQVADLVDQGWRPEAGADYGRLAWEDTAGRLRVTLDQVGPAGEALDDLNITRRRLEVKGFAADAVPTWLTRGIDEALASADLIAHRAPRLIGMVR